MTTILIFSTLALLVTIGIAADDEDDEIAAAWDEFFIMNYGAPMMPSSADGAAMIAFSEGGAEMPTYIPIVMGVEETQKKFNNFKASYKQVKDVNSQNLGYTAKINEYSDKDEQEWERNLMGLDLSKRPELEVDEMTMAMASPMGASLHIVPEELDWVDEGMVTPIKAQGNCGSCWAFAAIACLESHYAIKGGVLKTMSVQQLLDCGYPNEDACANGGWPSDGWTQIRSFLLNKYPTGNSYRYLAKTTECIEKRGENALVASNLGWPQFKRVTYETTQDGPYFDQAMADAVSIGPVAVAIRAIKSLRTYGDGIYSETNCNTYSPNHAVVVVGYTVTTFKIRNSWGSSWGIEGYANFDRKFQNLCFMAEYGEYPNVISTGKKDQKTDDVSGGGGLINPCAKITCMNGGKCKFEITISSTRTVCECPEGFGGDSCENMKQPVEVPDPCDLNPCLNGAACNGTGGAEYTCNCPKNYIGQKCDAQCVNTLKRCPKNTWSKKCKQSKYHKYCSVSCDTCGKTFELKSKGKGKKNKGKKNKNKNKNKNKGS